MGFQVIPILENCVDEFERVANNEGQLNLFFCLSTVVS
ncbi:hypothetical protein SORDD20_00052 [Streptococcus oralis]|nr:hypothetical protein SORDD20_00052 [Streptococcus oralis]